MSPSSSAREAGSGQSPGPLRVSWSQVSHQCGYQLKWHREKAPRGPLGIALIYGSAFHAGIEHHLLSRKGPDAAVEVALAYLRGEVRQAGRPGMRPISWDLPPRITKGGRPWSSDAGRAYDLASAEALLEAQVRLWIGRFGDLALVKDGCERRIFIKLTRPSGALIECVLDLLPEDSGILDLKTANKPWDLDDMEAKLGQARLYQAAYRQEFGRPPAYFRFHVLPKGTLDIQVIEVPWDAPAINRMLEHLVRPNLAAIAAGAYVPRPHGWWCSTKFCSWWDHCPLGAAAHPHRSAS